jgi:hypothetical protein
MVWARLKETDKAWCSTLGQPLPEAITTPRVVKETKFEFIIQEWLLGRKG